MSRETILAEIVAERQRQDGLFGGAEHDDTHTATDWISILVRHLGLAVDDGSPAGVCLMDDHCAGADPARYRRQMVRVAAVAVAALEVFDRKSVQSTAPAEPTAPVADPLDWWRSTAARLASRNGERVYIVALDDPSLDARSRGMFAVSESFARPWDREHAILVVEPEEVAT